MLALLRTPPRSVPALVGRLRREAVGMMPMIARLSGREILDSRGRPTVKATCVLEGGASG